MRLPAFVCRKKRKGAVRKAYRCEVPPDVAGVTTLRLNESSLVLLPRCISVRGIATPVCGLVRNDKLFSNSPGPAQS